MVDSSSFYEEKIFQFIQDVIIGIEKKIYSTPNVKDKLTKRDSMMYGINYLEFYLDQLYKNLVERNDEFMCNKFTELGNILNLHPVYTLNIISNVIMKSYPLLTRSKLNTINECEYLDSVIDITNCMKKYILTLFNIDFKKLIEEKNKCKEN